MSLSLFPAPHISLALRVWLLLLQMSPTGEHVSDVSDVLTVGQVVDVRIREVRS